jgi:undecaprenyl pyrophosphate phosphatase UppP
VRADKLADSNHILVVGRTEVEATVAAAMIAAARQDEATRTDFVAVEVVAMQSTVVEERRQVEEARLGLEDMVILSLATMAAVVVVVVLVAGTAPSLEQQNQQDSLALSGRICSYL